MDATQHSVTTPPAMWVRLGGASVIFGAIMALIYALAQHQLTSALGDAPLIILITLNTLIVYRLGCGLADDLGRLFSHTPRHARDPQKIVDTLLGTREHLLAGLCFATFMGVTVWHVDPWQATDQPRALRLWLCAFLFANNLIIGAVLLSLVRFWREVLHELPHAEISVLNPASPMLYALLTVNSRIVMGTALVACLSICSIPLSDYSMNPVTQVYSGLALGLVIATYAVPILPLSNILAARKAEALNEIERQIDAHVRFRIGLPPYADMPETPDKLTPMGDLIEARDLVSRVRTLPPGGQFSVSAAAVVTFLSFLPTLIDYVIEKLS